MRRSRAGRLLGLIGALALALTLLGGTHLAVPAMASGTAWREPVSPKMRTLQPLITNRAGRQAAAPLAPATTCNSAWNQVNSPGEGNASELISVSAAAANDIWSVGVFVNGSGVLQTLAEHWNGAAWTVVPTPNQGAGDNVLASVTAISGSDAWAVGYWSTDNNSPRQSLTMHWDGTSWTNVSTPQVASASNSLFGVGGDASNDVWAVGRYLNVPVPLSGPNGQTIAMHWDGHSWSIVPTPSGNVTHVDTSEFSAVKVLASNDAWAVGDGQDFTGSFAFPPSVLIEHWDGLTWTQAVTPPDNPQGDFLSDVRGTAGDLWAVGGQGSSSTTDNVLTQHWNGTTWADAPGVTPDQSANLFGLAYLASNNVYAVGASAYANPGTTSELDHTVIEQWNGTTWSQVTSANPSPNNDLFAATAISAGDVWAAGFMAPSGAPQTLTENLCTPPAVTGIAPAHGPGGTQVVITGTGFTGAVEVDFGTSAAAFHVDSDTQITAGSPGHSAGTVDVTVTVEGTSSTSAADQFTYVGRSLAPASPLVPFRNRAPVPPKFQAAPSQAQPFARPRFGPSPASVSSLIQPEWSTQRLLLGIAIASIYLIGF